MNPRDRDPAAPPPEPVVTAADWTTEESIAEPAVEPGRPASDPTSAPASGLGATMGDTPPPRTVARAAPTGDVDRQPPEPARPAERGLPPADADWPTAAAAGAPSADTRPAGGSPRSPGDTPTELPPGAWLASAHGLVPSDPSSSRGNVDPAFDPTADLDFGATRVHPRPIQPADDWGWQPSTADSTPAVPSVSARTTSPDGWVPFDPEADWGKAAQTGRQQATAGPAPYDADDPYGRQALVPRAAVVGHAGRSYDESLDPAAVYAAYDKKPRRRGMPWRRLFVSFALGLILTGVVAGGAIYAYEQQYVDRILPNVHVGAVDVSGLGRDAARDRLAEAYAGYGEGAVTVTLAGKTTEIPYAEFDRRADVDAMVDAAFAVGRAPSPVERLLGELRTVTKGATVAPSVVLDADKLAARVHEIAQAAESQPVDAGAVVTDIGFATTPSKTGQSVGEGTAAADTAAQLAVIGAPSTIDIALSATPLQPGVTDTSAQLATKQAALMQNDVVLQDGTDTWVVPAATVHQWLSFTVINNRVRIAIDTKAVLAQLKPLAKKIDRAAANATVKLQGTKIVFGKPSVDGRTFNPSKTTTAVVNGLRNRAIGSLAVDAPIPPVLALVKPTLTTDQAKAAIPLMKPISTWTTNYQPSERNGNGANIRIPTSTINGYVVAPGETFSFWKAVGPVTRELGYTDGGAIIDGHTEPQGALGGGICSCSTTLFNAALRAGFQMGDRLNHFYYINRYPLGLDATVFISASGQAQDMTWTNDSDYPVIIQGVNGKAYVRFVLYSVPNGRTTSFTDPIVKNYTKAHTETRVDKTIPRGTSKQIEYATDGQDVWVTRQVKDKAGTVIHKETFYSHYATITGIILVNR